MDGSTKSDTETDEQIERGRGFLTGEDREYLQGATEYEYAQSEINTRRRIRQRMRNARLDFGVAFEYLPEEDLEKVFDDLYGSPAEWNQDSHTGPAPAFEPLQALAELIGVLYLGTDNRRPDFEQLVELGVRLGEYRRLPEIMTNHQEMTVDCTIAVERFDFTNVNIEGVAGKIERGDWGRLTEAELRHFIRAYAETEEFETERVVEAVREAWEEQRETVDFDVIPGGKALGVTREESVEPTDADEGVDNDTTEERRE